MVRVGCLAEEIEEGEEEDGSKVKESGIGKRVVGC